MKYSLGLFVAMCLLSTSCSQDYEREYYPSGKIKYEVPLKHGKRNGRYKKFSESGNLVGVWEWKDGELEGNSQLFFDNGKVSQENFFKSGKRCCKSSFFYEDGTLKESHFFDEHGRLVDYHKFNPDGKRNTSVKNSYPILLADKDTVQLGDYYELEIRLGNKRWDSIRVVLGAWENYQALFNAPLPSYSSTVSYFRVRTDSLGINKVEGTIIEVNLEHSDSMQMFPFRKLFYVIDKKSKRT